MDLPGLQFNFSLDKLGRLLIDGKIGSFQLFKQHLNKKPLGNPVAIDSDLSVKKNNLVVGGITIPVNPTLSFSMQKVDARNNFIQINVHENNNITIYYLSSYSSSKQNEKTRDLFEIFPSLIKITMGESISDNKRQGFPEDTLKIETQMTESERLDTLKKLVEMSQELLLDDMAAALNLSRGDLMKNIVKWKDFGLILKGNSVIINNKEDFIKALDRSFKDWDAKTKNALGKM